MKEEFFGPPITEKDRKRLLRNQRYRDDYAKLVGGLKPKRQRQTAEKLKELQKIYSRNWRAKNIEKSRAASRKYDEKNPEIRNARARRRFQSNPEQVYAENAERRAGIRRARPAWANRFFMVEAYRLAILRTKITGFKWSVDHIVPLKSSLVCGFHCETNIQVIPAKVNSAKGNRRWPNMP